MQEPLIKAIAGTKHHTMLPEADRSPVPILCQMSNDQNSHANLPDNP